MLICSELKRIYTLFYAGERCTLYSSNTYQCIALVKLRIFSIIANLCTALICNKTFLSIYTENIYQNRYFIHQ